MTDLKTDSKAEKGKVWLKVSGTFITPHFYQGDGSFILFLDLREAVTRLRSADVNVVSGILKLYFRELPEPLIPTELFPNLTRMLGKIPLEPGETLSLKGKLEFSFLKFCPRPVDHLTLKYNT